MIRVDEIVVPEIEPLAPDEAMFKQIGQRPPVDVQEEMDAAYHALFSSRHGKRVLTHLVQMTMGTPSFDHTLPMDRAVPYGFGREGQNALVRMIIRFMRRHEATMEGKTQTRN